MNDIDVALEAKKFSMDWHERGYEKGETQKFWRELLQKVLQVPEPDKIVDYEVPVPNGYIDAYLPATKVLIEQKSFGTDLDEKINHNGIELTPFEQAMRYADALPDNKKPRWIITCNFAEFRIYNLSENLFTPRLTTFKLRELVYEYPRLEILINLNADDSSPQERISRAALADIEKIYNAFKLNYQKNKVRDFEDDLNKICTRLVFCLYAGDAKIFDTAKRIFDTEKFFGYITKFDSKNKIAALQKIFDVFSLEITKRNQNLDDDLRDFPYVDGGLFDEKIPLPDYNKFITNPADTLGNVKAIRNFRWREISPPIFGAMFESKFSRREEQREHGIFYTSIENIHKVIDPLFMDDLRGELDSVKRMQKKNRVVALKNFQDKIASLNFLDPACGSGNFLTETYLSLRRLENEVIEELYHLYADLPPNPIKVTPRQFYGIEIDSFAAAVARLALCIADIQMKRETSWIINRELPELPLSKFVSIQKANALRVDWKDFAPNVNYIIGNPPFVGKSYQTREQKKDMAHVFENVKGYGNLDYVACWYKRASEFMADKNVRSAFISTNSICQGIAVPPLWKNLFDAGNHIDFAHRTFIWNSESTQKAHVHCVIVGLSSAPNSKPKIIFDGEKGTVAENINAYLINYENIFVEPRNTPLNPDAPPMIVGSCPTDGGNLIIEADDLDYFIQNDPAAMKWIRRYVGSNEFINGIIRYCLWLKDCPPSEIKKMPLVAERVEAVEKFRLASKKVQTCRRADTPTLFAEDRFIDAPAIIIPRTSSGERQYIPMGFVERGVIVNLEAMLIPNGDLYTFGMLMSSIHMAWMRTTCGRFGTGYRYSTKMAYNTFPWCEVSANRRRLIESTAQRILDVRADFPTWTFAKLYNEDTMPDALRDAHKMNDMAVALAYGFGDIVHDEAKVVAELMKLYQELTTP